MSRARGDNGDGPFADGASDEGGADVTQTAGAQNTQETALSSSGRVVSRGQLERGQSVGRYVIYELLGAGGMGAVYQAYDPELNRGVALKVLRVAHRRSSDPTLARARLEREAQAMAQLAHPNVVAVHDVGRFDDDLFIAMELVEGQTLKKWRKAAPRSREEILEVFRGAGLGLAAAHRAGMVHRDFKPDNVLVGDDGRVRVADFGLARGAGTDSTSDFGASSDIENNDESNDDNGLDWASGNPSSFTPPSIVHTPLTQAGAIVGTPAYMAPEQYLGQAIDAGTDQFSFCVALYEALYDQRPFVANDAAGLRRAVTTGRLAPPPSGANVPGWLRKVVLRGLSTSPQDRYPSIDDLLVELSRDPRRVRRRWVTASVAALFAAGLGAGLMRSASAPERTLCADSERWLVGVWDGGVRTSLRAALAHSDVAYADATGERVGRILDTYAKQWSEVHTHACESTHIYGTQSGEMLDLRMQCLDRSKQRVRAFVQLLRDEHDAGLIKNAVKAAVASTDIGPCSDERALRAQQTYPEPIDPDERAQVAGLHARIDELDLLQLAGRYREGVELGRTVVADADSLGHAPAQAQVRRSMGILLWNAGNSEESNRHFAEGLPFAARAGDHITESVLTTKRIWVLGYLLGQHDTAFALLPSAEAAIVRAGDTPKLRQQLHGAIGAVYFSKGEFQKARERWQQRLALLEPISEPLDPALGWAYNNLSAVLLRLGEYDTAVEQLERARAIWEVALGPDHPAMATLSNNLGIAYENSDRIEEAIAAQDRAIAIFERVLGPEHHQVAMALNNLGATLLRKRDFAGAETYFRRALAIPLERGGPATHLTAVAYTSLGKALAAQGKGSEAVVAYRRAVKACEDTVGPHDARTGKAYRTLAQALVGFDDPEAAIAAYDKALANLEANESPLAPDVKFQLAKALRLAGVGRTRARALARAARDALAVSDQAEGRLREIDAWLRAPGPRSR